MFREFIFKKLLEDCFKFSKPKFITSKRKTTKQPKKYENRLLKSKLIKDTNQASFTLSRRIFLSHLKFDFRNKSVNNSLCYSIY